MGLSLEWKLLLACARTQLTSEDSQRIEQELVHLNVGWDRLIERACQHGIEPLLYYNLQRLGVPSAVPRAAIEVLRRAYYSNAARNALLYKELHQALSALRETGSAVIVLKGAALAETVYPNRALRPMSDIDLLVRKEEVSRAEAKLSAMGYVFQEHPKGEAWLREQYYHSVFVKDAITSTEIHLEIHWHLERPSRPFQINIDGLWDRAVPATIAGVETLVLSPEDLLLHLCLHTCKHKLTGGLRPFCDIAETIRQYGQHLDWGQIQTRASQWQINQYVYLPLQLARKMLGAAVPEPALDALQPEGFDARLLDWAREEILEDKGTSPIFPDLLQLWQGHRVKDRVAVLMKILSPTVIADYYAIPPASKKRYFYYPVRLKDLLMRYGPVLWRLARRDRQLTGLAHRKSKLGEWLAPFNESSKEKGLGGFP